MLDRGKLLESDLNGMAIFVLPIPYHKKTVTIHKKTVALIKTAEAAYDEWMSEADEVGDEAICDWVIKRLKENGFEYEKDYRIFVDLNWD